MWEVKQFALGYKKTNWVLFQGTIISAWRTGGAREAISDTLQPYKARSPRTLWGFYLILRTPRVSILKVEKDFVGHGARLTKLSFAFQIPYIETSAKDPPLNVDKAFHDLVRVIR